MYGVKVVGFKKGSNNLCPHDGRLCSKISEDYDEGLGCTVRMPSCISVSAKGLVRICGRFKGMSRDEVKALMRARFTEDKSLSEDERKRVLDGLV